MGTLSLMVMIVAVIGVVVLILLFERSRAHEVQRDLRQHQHTAPPPRAWERDE
jgi:hypothetical protein